MATSSSTRFATKNLRYLRAVRPLDFPSSEPWSEKVPETKRHAQLRTFLFQVLLRALTPEHSVGGDQFVYWNAREPRRSCAPDVFVKLDVADALFDSWKTWERGVPELVIEILSASDREVLTWSEKLERFHEIGVREVLCFDVDAPRGCRLRAWDRLHDDLIERVVSTDMTPCLTLGAFWVVAPGPDLVDALRISFDPEGRHLLLSPVEAAESELAIAEVQRDAAETEREAAKAGRAAAETEREAAEARRAAAETEREAAEARRAAAEARVVELEAELRRREP